MLKKHKKVYGQLIESIQGLNALNDIYISRIKRYTKHFLPVRRIGQIKEKGRLEMLNLVMKR